MKKFNVLLIAVFFSSLVFNSCKEEPRFDEPQNLISADVARLLNSNYNQTRHRLISSSIQREDANAIWYSIEELENYINYAKRKARDQNYSLTGLRFYLGAYPENSQDYGEAAGLTTVFVSPTGRRLNVQKGSVLNLPATTMQQVEENPDIESIDAMNYGGMGHPPKVIYPSNQ